MKFLFFIVITIGICLCVCPNNCNAHGKCVNNVCECYKKSAGFDSDYRGSDCSQRGCDSGISYSAVTSEFKYSSRRSDESNQIGDRRLLYNEDERKLLENENELVTILSWSESDDSSTYLVRTDREFQYYGNVVDFNNVVGGKLNCYNENNEFKGYYDLIGKVKELSYYIQKKDNNNPNLSGLRCEMIMIYEDFTLINPTEVVIDDKAKTVTWKNMAKIFSYLYDITIPSTAPKMTCGSDFTVSSITKSGDGKDLVFTLSDSPAASGECVLYAKRDLTAITDKDESDKAKYVEVKNPTDTKIEGVGSDNQKLYKVNKISSYNKYTEGSIGKLSCYIPGSRTIQNAYLLGVNSDNYYIVYDFTPVGEDGKTVSKVIPYLYYCKLNEYNDYSLYYPVKLTTEDSILWKGVYTIINNILPDGETSYEFACRNKENIVKLFTLSVTKGVDNPTKIPPDITFTVSGDPKPATTDICYIIAAKGDELVGIEISESELYKKHLTVEKTEKTLKYITLTETPTFSNSGIYKVIGLNINSGKTGGIIECNGANGLFTADLLYKEGNNYYIYTENTLKDIPCKFSYSHKDLSSITPSETGADTYEVVFNGMSYYFQQYGFFNSISEEYTMLCDKGSDNNYKEFKYELSEDSKPIKPIYQSTSGDVKFTLKTEETPPGEGKQCYLLSSFNGKYINPLSSDLTKKFTITKENTAGEWKMVEKTSESISANQNPANSGIYEVSGVEYEGISEAGGILECYSKSGNIPLGLARIFGYNSKKYYIKYYFKTPATNDELAKYICSVIDNYNDLSLYLPPLKCDGGKCENTYSILTSDVNSAIGLTISSGKTVNLLCGKNEDYTLYTNSVSVNGGTTITYDNTAINGNNCFVLSKFDGTAVEVLKSDLTKIFDITQIEDGNYKLKRKSNSPYGTEVKKENAGLGIYDVKNSKYSIGDELFCLTNDDNSNPKSLILNVNEKKDGYYMDYVSGKSLLYFNCMKMNKYNDLSMLVKGTTSSNKLTSPIKANELYYMGYLQSSSKPLQFICDGEEKTATSYTPNAGYTPSGSNSDVEFTFSAEVENCHLMSTFDGKSLELKNSDLRKYNYIEIENKEYKYYEDTEEKPNYNTNADKINKNQVEIIGEIGEIGGNLQCKNKKDGKYLGSALLLGLDEFGN